MASSKKRSDWPRRITVGHATVTVYRNVHPRTASGWIYIVSWIAPRGREREKFADEGLALEEARLKAAQLASGRVEGASMSTGDRDELQAARQLCGQTPLLSALEEWKKASHLTAGNVLAACKAWAARNGKVQKRVLVKDVVREFLKAKTAAGKNVASDHSSTFELIVSELGEFTIDGVSAKQLDVWLALAENPVTRNTRRKRIVSVWRWAQRKGYLPRDARTEAEMTERAHEPAPVVGIISSATFASLLEFFRARHPEYLPALAIAGFCGLRRSEVHGQSWDDINLAQRHLRVTTAKRGTPARRLVPLPPAAVEWLLLAPDRTEAVCSNLAIDRIRHIARHAKKEDGTPRFSALPDNCFRHSYISHALAASGDIARTSLDSGNSSGEIQRHYRELVTEAEGKAWAEQHPNAVAPVVTLPYAQSANA